MFNKRPQTRGGVASTLKNNAKILTVRSNRPDKILKEQLNFQLEVPHNQAPQGCERGSGLPEGAIREGRLRVRNMYHSS